jgi:hypothetical protein
MSSWSGIESIIGSLANQDLILPYFENAIISESWPDEYDIKVDSRPYYGKGDGYFHPSTHPLMGERQLYYMFHPDTAADMVWERPSLMREMWFAMGSALHAVLQTQMQQCGLVPTCDPKQCWGGVHVCGNVEREYVNDEHKVRGRIDWVVNHPNGSVIPVEFKTINSWGYKSTKEPKAEWLAQLNMALDNTGHDFGVLLMAERGGQFGMREFHVKRDQELIDSIYAKFDRVREAIAANEPPKYCCAPNTKEMDACPARFECWLKKDVA